MTDFYKRDAWRDLRYQVLRKFGFKCMACNRTREQGAIIHVDHIKPVSIFPELALSESNLQVLCDACNMGKSNRFIDDLRPRLAKAEPLPPAVQERIEWIKMQALKAEQAGNLIEHEEHLGEFLSLIRKARGVR